jgi:hypothetical protein
MVGSGLSPLLAGASHFSFEPNNSMKPPVKIGRRTPIFCLVLLLFSFAGYSAKAQVPPPGFNPLPQTLDSWSFDDTNWLSDLNYAPVSFTNVVSVLYRGDNNVLSLDTTNAAWLNYNLVEPSSTNELTLTNGTILLWFAPNWASTNEGGSGPGDMGQLLSVGEWTADASYGYWGISIDAAGANLSFSAQGSDGSETNYFTVPIDWNSNYWHQIAVTYSPTGSALYLDGNFVTNGAGVSIVPDTSVSTNGFYVGSDTTGFQQAHGMFDDLFTFDHALDSTNVMRLFEYTEIDFWGNPYNALFSQRISPPSPAYPTPPTFEIFSGPTTNLSWLGSVACITSTNFWMTNLIATMSGSGSNMTGGLQFEIAGGTSPHLYDIFANASLSSSSTNFGWAWMGQGFDCNVYSLTNLPGAAAFLMLGDSSIDSDGDGLSDAYELLVSHTDPHNPDSDGDGVSDGDEVMNGTDPLTANAAFPSIFTVSCCPQ